MHRHLWGQGWLALLLVTSACGGTKQEPVGGTKMEERDPADVGVAQVDAVLHARVLSASESLAVRLLGMVGPDGSWSLAEVAVDTIPGGVRLTPIVQHRPGGNVIQMLIPLDEEVRVPLQSGVQRVVVRGRDSTFTETVRVGPGAGRVPPDTHLGYQVVTSGIHSHQFVVFESFPGDGFVAAIEYREFRAAGPGPWQRLEGCQREGARLSGRMPVSMESDVLKIEARAVSGQGDRDPEPASMNLPKEP